MQQKIFVFDELMEEHRELLRRARALQDALSGDVPSSVASAPDFSELCERVSRHLRKEEEALLPVLARYGTVRDDFEPVTRMLLGHARIRKEISRLGGEAARGRVGSFTLQKFAYGLARGVLEEEQEYRYLEERLPNEALEEISERLSARYGGDPSPSAIP
ncbi:hypothetical protein GBA65_07760 [Rubrobacter marinus]|uniref:Hemerythrin-like domain-containing protein n=1 Tax=Rubrobacter marinus TaxID=2653852 RepID=A0A6G8PWB1_9ACTN|nr:hemerythrin domain-containing protein [Rubrobacter marinus]QIN78437.1 hypothetical protein GBA65_07760 [Rubrobacter marinus]